MVGAELAAGGQQPGDGAFPRTGRAAQPQDVRQPLLREVLHPIYSSPTIRRKAASSNTLTPSFSALASLEPARSPATK